MKPSEVRSTSALNGGSNQIPSTTPVSNTVCYLTRVAMQDIDNSNETAVCILTQALGFWLLGADVTDDKDGDVWCEMSCFTF